MGGRIVKKSAIIASVLLLGATLVGCGGGGNTSGGSSGSGNEIVVGADTTFPPFTKAAAGGGVEGFDIDLVKKIAEVEGLKIKEIKTMPFTGIVPAVNSKQVDLAVAGITIKKSRMQQVNFSNAYYRSGLSILVKADSKITGLDDLKDKLVGTKKGTSSVDLLQQHHITNVKQFENINEAYAALESGGVDAVVFDNPVNLNFKNEHNDVKIVGGLLTGEYYGIAVNKDETDLLNKINDGLKKLQENGEYAKLFDTYFGGDKSGMVDGVKAPQDVALDS
jgi:polar amino acid transport system substrate-binding protein/glutamine transport system substrate-binding protein